MKKCKSCGKKFDDNFSISTPNERMMEEIEREIEEGKKCGACIFNDAFYNESMRDI